MKKFINNNFQTAGWKKLAGIIIISWIIFSATYLILNYYFVPGQDGFLNKTTFNQGENENLTNYKQRLQELSRIKANPEERIKNIILQTAGNNPKSYYMRNEILYHNSSLSRFEASYRALYIYNTATKYEVDPYLITAVGIVESNHKQSSVSNKGAVGIMQLTPTVERIYGVNADILEENILGGTQFIKDLQEQYGELKLALAHYNGGSRPYYKIQNYDETKAYVDKVLNIYNSMKNRYENRAQSHDNSNTEELPASENSSQKSKDESKNS